MIIFFKKEQIKYYILNYLISIKRIIHIFFEDNLKNLTKQKFKEAFMEVLHDKNDKMFYMLDSDRKIFAEMYYSYLDSGKIKITHTWVDTEHRGQDLGKSLMDSLASFAREENLKIIPVCSFAVYMVEKFSSLYSDILDNSFSK
ncbi:MAG: GNAT family N-acetyltransferase [Fusobacteriaceae bacterium]